ncbi:MAG: sigma 54-interacting transcriptional regulator [Thermoanaerobaculia bacterium]|nr:sigma 54-interacting transcriptional regulator [Thermoanaerobaculia bacterium]
MTASELGTSVRRTWAQRRSRAKKMGTQLPSSRALAASSLWIQIRSYDLATMEQASIVARLVGEVGGRKIDRVLAEGRYRIGSSSQSDICLQDAGVSRQHAILIAATTGITVVDCGSTNGTRIDGHRIQRGLAALGSMLGIGPVELRLEPAEESELAIDFGPPASQSLPSDLPTESSTLAVDLPQAPSRWLAILESVIRTSRLPTFEGLGDVLEPLRQHPAVRGVACLRWLEGRPEVLSATGQLGSLPESSQLDQAAPPDENLWSLAIETPAPCAMGLCRRGPDRLFGIAIWLGSVADLSAECLAVARCLVAVLQTGEEEGSSPPLPEPRLRDLDFPPGHRPGNSGSMVELYDQLRRLLGGDLPVFITGETGVGKEDIARTLHRSSDRSTGPFVAINCAAIPDTLLEAEMFGAERGAATGVGPRRGCFQEAHGGVLFLDEVAELAPELQSKMLRALQQKEVRPVGGRTRSVDVRVVAATNVDPQAALASGRLRPDLFYRLTGCILTVPALRRRRSDIPGLVEYLLRRHAGEQGKQLRGLSWKAMQILVAYDWPGNVRQLDHEIQRLVHGCENRGVIGQESISQEVLKGATAELESSDELLGQTVFDDLDLTRRVQELERHLIHRALAQAQGQKKLAAKLLGISRNGLSLKIERLGIEVSRPSGGDEA